MESLGEERKKRREKPKHKPMFDKSSFENEITELVYHQLESERINSLPPREHEGAFELKA